VQRSALVVAAEPFAERAQEFVGFTAVPIGRGHSRGPARESPAWPRRLQPSGTHLTRSAPFPAARPIGPAMKNSGTEAILRLKTEKDQKIVRLRELLDRSEVERRGLSKSERATYAQLERDVEQLDTELRKLRARDFDPRFAQGTNGTAMELPETGDLLGPEARVADWVRERRGTDISDLGDTDFSLGRCLAALVRRDRSQLNELEQRALFEGVDASGGFLIPEPLSAILIDRLRNISRVFAAGGSWRGMASRPSRPTRSSSRVYTGSRSTGAMRSARGRTQRRRCSARSSGCTICAQRSPHGSASAASMRRQHGNSAGGRALRLCTLTTCADAVTRQHVSNGCDAHSTRNRCQNVANRSERRARASAPTDAQLARLQRFP
jgi:hypothetical protein